MNPLISKMFTSFNLPNQIKCHYSQSDSNQRKMNKSFTVYINGNEYFIKKMIRKKGICLFCSTMG